MVSKVQLRREIAVLVIGILVLVAVLWMGLQFSNDDSENSGKSSKSDAKTTQRGFERPSHLIIETG